MTKKEKALFVSKGIDYIKNDILKNLSKFPEEWDAVELRWYILDRFSDIVIPSVDEFQRRKRYNSFVDSDSSLTPNIWLISWCKDYIKKTKKYFKPRRSIKK